MSNNDAYIITSLSSSIKQAAFKNGAIQTPYVLGVRGSNTLRLTCQPYTAVGGGVPNFRNVDDCGISDVTERLPLVQNISDVFAPDVYGQIKYTEIIDATVYGTTSTHVGSIYLESGTLGEIGVLVCTTEVGTHRSTQIKRFTDNVELTSFDAGLAKCGYSNNSLITVPASDWYDIYLSGTFASTTSSLEGIYIEYNI